MLRPRVRRLFRLAVRRPERAAAEMDDEIRFHIDMRVSPSSWRAAGRRMPPLAEAMRLFGPFPEMRRSLHAAARRREEILTMSDKFDALRHDTSIRATPDHARPGARRRRHCDVRAGYRRERDNVGIIDRLLLRPPAHVRAPEELQRIELRRKWPGEEFTSPVFSYPAYTDIRDRVPGFSSVAMQTYPSPISLGLGPDARKINGVIVSGTYFGTLAPRTAALGRAIQATDDIPPDGSPVAVIGYGLWQREFGGSREAIGKTIALASRGYTIVGVAQKGFIGTGSEPSTYGIPVTAAEGLRFAGSSGRGPASWAGLAAMVPSVFTVRPPRRSSRAADCRGRSGRHRRRSVRSHVGAARVRSHGSAPSPHASAECI